MSPYNYCAGNPVKMVDPDERVMRDNGEVRFTVENDNTWCFYEINDLKNGEKQGIAFKAKRGSIYLNNGKAIEAYQAIEDASLIYRVSIDKNGKEDSEPILD